MTLRRLIFLFALTSAAAYSQQTGGGGPLQVAADPSGACAVGSNLQYNNTNGKLWGCDAGTWTQVSGGGGSMTWPSTPGITACTGAPCTAWGTSLTAPAGTIVGTTDTQTLTNKTVDGVSPTTFGFLDPTSSVQTQLNAKAASNASTTVNGTTCTLGSSCTIALSAVNPQTATYQALAADFSNYKTITVASGTFTITLVASGTQPANGQNITIVNYGSGVVTIARSGQNINGGTSSLTLAAGSATAPTSARVWSDGTNYFASVSASSTGGGGSNITSGTYSSLPGTCAHSSTASDAYWPSDSYYQMLCTATNTWSPFMDGKQVVLPGAASGWTLVNGASGTAAKADSAGAVSLSTTSSVVGLEAILKAIPSAPYTKTIAFKVFSYPTTGANSAMQCGVIWAGGTTTASAAQGLFVINQTGSSSIRLELDHFTNFTWSGGAADATFAWVIGVATNAIVWIRIADDNTNRKVSWSTDGVKFVQLYSTARATPFTPTHYGVGCGSPNFASGLPWALTLLSDN